MTEQEWLSSSEPAAYQRGRDEERVRCVEICHNEQREYEANAKKCDKAGKAYAGTMDSYGALVCTRIAEAILATDQPAQPVAKEPCPKCGDTGICGPDWDGEDSSYLCVCGASPPAQPAEPDITSLFKQHREILERLQKLEDKRGS